MIRDAGNRLPDQNRSSWPDRQPETVRAASMAVLGAHLKWQVMSRGVVVAVTNGHLDGSIERSVEGFDRAQPRASRRGIAEVFGTWERIFQGQTEWLAR